MIEFSRDESRWGRGGTFALFEHGSALSGKNDTGVDARSPAAGTGPEGADGGRARPGASRGPSSGRRTGRSRALAGRGRGPLPHPGRLPARWGSGPREAGPWSTATSAWWTARARCCSTSRCSCPPAPARPQGFREGARGTRPRTGARPQPAGPAGDAGGRPLPHGGRGARGLAAGFPGRARRPHPRRPGAPPLLRSPDHPLLPGRLLRPGPLRVRRPERPRADTDVYINAGVGTSVMPIRFWCPPRFGRWSELRRCPAAPPARQHQATPAAA